MPELPDVEGFRRDLEAHAAGRVVTAVRVRDRGVLRNTTPQALGRALRGRRLDLPARHGKWLQLRTEDGPTVLVHPGMTGNVAWSAAADERPPYERVVLELDEGEVRYADLRKLRGLWLADAGRPLEDLTGPLGPDVLGLRKDTFAGRLAGLRRALKPALMDQEVVAGLGNLLVDEILWRARLHPRRRTDGVEGEELTRLHRAVGRVLRDSLPAGRVPDLRTWLTGRRDDPGGACPRCGTALAHGTVGSRSTVWCPRCQPEP